MKAIQRDGANISYQVSGQGDITLLFVHGSYIDHSYWKKQVSFFSQDYTVVTLDLPGHGQSGTERKNWSVRGFADDVVALIRALDLRNVILIGHSLGAGICLMAATTYPTPIIGFIAVEFFRNAGQPLSADYQQQAATITQQLQKDFRNTNEQYARTALLTPQTSPAIAKRIVEAYRNAYQPMGLATTPEIFSFYKEEARLLPTLPFKLYVINVDYMPINENALQGIAPNGYEVLHMKGTCHYPMLEHPDQLNSLLHEAVQEIAVGQYHGYGAH
ncbi:MAG TPA: alpha/beta hydrolase [Chitinophagaceae bacterium]|nr:alpha/beta hydrolase [Chitinophagaceae bacterium]